MQLQTLCLVLLCACTIPGVGATTMRCISWGDPHIHTFHRYYMPPSPYKDCMGNGLLTLVRTPLVTFIVDVYNYWMIELTLTFRNRTNGPAVCAVSSNNFVLSPDNGCRANGVYTTLTDNGVWVTLSVYYPAGQFSTVITYYKPSYFQYYNIEVWLPEDVVYNSTGVCSTQNCDTYGPRIPRSVRTTGGNLNISSGLSNRTAAEICDIHVQNYLNSLTRNPSQRDANYNGTIAALRDMCVFDVMTYGPEAATAVVQMLMIQEQTTGISDVAQIQTAFENNLQAALTNAARMINESQADVIDLLNVTTTQSPTTSSTVISSSSGSTTISSTTSSATTTIGGTHSSSSSTTTGSATVTVSSTNSTITASTNAQRSTTTVLLSAAFGIQAHKFWVVLAVVFCTLMFK